MLSVYILSLKVGPIVGPIVVVAAVVVVALSVVVVSIGCVVSESSLRSAAHEENIKLLSVNLNKNKQKPSEELLSS